MLNKHEEEFKGYLEKKTLKNKATKIQKEIEVPVEVKKPKPVEFPLHHCPEEGCVTRALSKDLLKQHLFKHHANENASQEWTKGTLPCPLCQEELPFNAHKNHLMEAHGPFSSVIL